MFYLFPILVSSVQTGNMYFVKSDTYLNQHLYMLVYIWQIEPEDPICPLRAAAYAFVMRREDLRIRYKQENR